MTISDASSHGTDPNASEFLPCSAPSTAAIPPSTSPSGSSPQCDEPTPALSPVSSYAPSPAPLGAPSPVPTVDVDAIARLRQDLHDARWCVSDVDALLSPAARGALMRDQRIPALVELGEIPATSPDASRATLTRLFMLGSVENRADLESALPTLGVDGALALGLIRQVDTAQHSDQGAHEGEAYQAAFDLRPHAASLPTPASFTADGDPDERADHHWWVLSDLGEATTGQPLQRDHVLGIGGATMNLLSLTVRRPVARALDIGTGCGIQALYLATHADQVVATDISQRAVEMTRLNAALNGVDIDVRQGSLFEPVAGERFDLIVSNPPFVITPDSLRQGGLMEYRDGGMERDSLIGSIIRSAPEYLADGGLMQMLGNWEILGTSDPAEQWHERVDQWLAGLPVEAWVVQRDVLDPTQYVEMWIRDSGGTLQAREEVESIYAAWIADFARAGVGHIGMGSVALRRIPCDGAGQPMSEAAARPSPGTQALAAAGSVPTTLAECEGDGPALHRVYDYLPEGNAPTGADVIRAMGCLDLSEDVWGQALVRQPDVTEERHLTPGSEELRVIILNQGGGMGRSLRVGSNTSAFVGACDGDLTAGQIAQAIAVITDQEPGVVRGEIASALPELLRSGMLVRAIQGR